MISMVAKEIRGHDRSVTWHQRWAKLVLWDPKLHQERGVWKCKAVDISPGGVKIQIAERLAINSRVLLTIGRVGSFPGEVR